MKQIWVTALFATISFFALAQKIPAGKVPAAVKASFEKNYPGAAAGWEKENGNYEAGFTCNKQNISVLFDPGGRLLETETAIAINNLPQPVTAYIKAHFPGKKIKEAAKIVDAAGTVTYEAEVNGADQIFDAAGNFLKAQKD